MAKKFRYDSINTIVDNFHIYLKCYNEDMPKNKQIRIIGYQTHIIKSILHSKLFGIYKYENKVEGNVVMRFITEYRMYTLPFKLGDTFINFLHENAIMDIYDEKTVVDTINSIYDDYIMKNRYGKESLNKISSVLYKKHDEDIESKRDRDGFIIRYPELIITNESDIVSEYISSINTLRDDRLINLINGKSYSDSFNNTLNGNIFRTKGFSTVVEPLFALLKLNQKGFYLKV